MSDHGNYLQSFGRVQFAEAQILGRQGRLALADIRNLERRQAREVVLDETEVEAFKMLLDETEVEAFKMLRQRMLSGRPRTIAVSAPQSPVLVFTDGAFEPSGDGMVATVGGVIFTPNGNEFLVRAFGCRLGQTTLDRWLTNGRKHLIGQVELYAVVLARGHWSSWIDNERTVFFIDHAGVVGACISGNSREKTWRELLVLLEDYDSKSPCVSWFTRVPSQSNISDGPSRGSWDQLSASFGFTREAMKCPFTHERLEDI